MFAPAGVIVNSGFLDITELIWRVAVPAFWTVTLSRAVDPTNRSANVTLDGVTWKIGPTPFPDTETLDGEPVALWTNTICPDFGRRVVGLNVT